MTKKLNRRDFIKNTTANTVGVASIASGISLTTFAASENPVSNEKRWGMLIDTNKLSEANIEDMVDHSLQSKWKMLKHSLRFS